MVHDDKIVIFGMSCVGKTTFAESVRGHDYFCFDALFDWYSIETLGLSITTSLAGISKIVARSDRYVLDGWHLADKGGRLLPEETTVYVLYADYERIIGQYRIEIRHPEEYRFMFRRWYYEVPYGQFPRVKYWENQGGFIERSVEEFHCFLEANR